MSRKQSKITDNQVNAALRAAHDGHKQYEIGDLQVPGLCLRVRKRTASWALRTRLSGKQTTIVIGAVDALTDIEEVRKIAVQGKVLAKEGTNPRGFFDSAVQASTAAGAAALERKKAGKEWTWEEAVEKYLDYIKKNKRLNTHRPYKSALKHRSTEPLKGKLLSQITGSDIRKVRKNLSDLGKLAQFRSTVQQVKYCLNYAVLDEESGIDVNPAQFLATKPKKKSITLEDALADMNHDSESERHAARVMAEWELGVFLWEVETLRQPFFRLAMILELFTGQRRYTVATAMKRGFKRDREYGLLWHIHAGLEKTARGRSLPLIGIAREAAEQALLISPSDKPWLFPQLRKRRATDAGNGHMSEKALNVEMRKLQESGRPLHSDDAFSPNSLRKSFITYTSELGFEEPQRQLVTHDAEGRTSVHEKIYNADQKLPKKLEILQAWHDFLMRCKAKYKPDQAATYRLAAE